MRGTKMELRYDLKLTDVINFYLHSTRQSKSNLRRMRNKKVKLFLVTLSILLILQWFYIRPSSLFSYVYSLLISLIPVIFYSFYVERTIARKFRKFHKNSREPNLFGTYHLLLRKDGLEVLVKEGHKDFYAWKDLQSIVKVKNYIYIYTDAIHAIIVPMRVFSQKDECMPFLKELTRRIKETTKQSMEVKEL